MALLCLGTSSWNWQGWGLDTRFSLKLCSSWIKFLAFGNSTHGGIWPLEMYHSKTVCKWNLWKFFALWIFSTGLNKTFPQLDRNFPIAWGSSGQGNQCLSLLRHCQCAHVPSGPRRAFSSLCAHIRALENTRVCSQGGLLMGLGEAEEGTATRTAETGE